jgi:serine protease Do
MIQRWTSRGIAGLAAFCLAFLISATASAADPKPDVKWDTGRTSVPTDVAELKALQDRVKLVVDKCTPSTVGILIGFGAGSGVIVSEDGLVLTAAHVITGEDSPSTKGSKYEAGAECKVILPDGKTVKAKTLGVNAEADSGMIKITEKGPNDGKWPFVTIAKSADLKKGQWVVSLGHPGGPKTNRPPVARLGRIERVSKDTVTSNCTLVGGDSGGPLFDLDGKLIGIHSRIGPFLSMNYHIPTEIFKHEWDQLVAGEVLGRPEAFVGIILPEEDNEDAYLLEVAKGSPAFKAGLKVGDTITKLNGLTVKSVKRYRELIKQRSPDETVRFTIRRGTETLTLPVKLVKKAKPDDDD